MGGRVLRRDFSTQSVMLESEKLRQFSQRRCLSGFDRQLKIGDIQGMQSQRKRPSQVGAAPDARPAQRGPQRSRTSLIERLDPRQTQNTCNWLTKPEDSPSQNVLAALIKFCKEKSRTFDDRDTVTCEFEDAYHREWKFIVEDGKEEEKSDVPILEEVKIYLNTREMNITITDFYQSKDGECVLSYHDEEEVFTQDVNLRLANKDEFIHEYDAEQSTTESTYENLSQLSGLIDNSRDTPGAGEDAEQSTTESTYENLSRLSGLIDNSRDTPGAGKDAEQSTTESTYENLSRLSGLIDNSRDTPGAGKDAEQSTTE